MTTIRHITTHGKNIFVDEFMAAENDLQIIHLAIDSFGFLLTNPISYVKRVYSFTEFAEAIEKSFDCANPKTHSVVAGLRRLGQLAECSTSDAPAPQLH